MDNIDRKLAALKVGTEIVQWIEGTVWATKMTAELEFPGRPDIRVVAMATLAGAFVQIALREHKKMEKEGTLCSCDKKHKKLTSEDLIELMSASMAAPGLSVAFRFDEKEFLAELNKKG